uniref:Putative glutaredoxin n=1 Tax=viral metagenome TaxID=1070528 RepID=A0A6H1ZYT5_9ZZZZ
MTFVVYGTAACANCKALVSMAKARGIEPVYHLIDSDPALYDQFRELADLNFGLGATVQLPFVVVTGKDVSSVHTGIQGGMEALKFYQSIKE